ncbi:MAG: hypothetical protein J7641_12270 [Cyanobacteria bacterium SID2]|nr:hypothetical protein [Cyanobacteria bacterium SID2]MBP0006032.1 hypothetical protein [Cyanobacteria bacterium SBC]
MSPSDPVRVFESAGTLVSPPSPAPNTTGSTFLYETTTDTPSYDADGTGSIPARSSVTL